MHVSGFNFIRHVKNCNYANQDTKNNIDMILQYQGRNIWDTETTPNFIHHIDEKITNNVRTFIYANENPTCRVIALLINNILLEVYTLYSDNYIDVKCRY